MEREKWARGDVGRCGNPERWDPERGEWGMKEAEDAPSWASPPASQGPPHTPYSRACSPHQSPGRIHSVGGGEAGRRGAPPSRGKFTPGNDGNSSGRAGRQVRPGGR